MDRITSSNDKCIRQLETPQSSVHGVRKLFSAYALVKSYSNIFTSCCITSTRHVYRPLPNRLLEKLKPVNILSRHHISPTTTTPLQLVFPEQSRVVDRRIREIQGRCPGILQECKQGWGEDLSSASSLPLRTAQSRVESAGDSTSSMIRHPAHQCLLGNLLWLFLYGTHPYPPH